MSQEEFLLRDERIHCLFYFLSPHSLKQIDVAFLSRVSSIVPIIPVIAKADTLTVMERNFFLKEVYKTVEKISCVSCAPIIYKFHGTENGSEAISTLRDIKHADGRRATIINKIMQLIKVNGRKQNSNVDLLDDGIPPHWLPFDDTPILTTADAYIINTTVARESTCNTPLHGQRFKRSEVSSETPTHDSLFNQETFVNIGQALSANSPDSDCVSIISSDAVSMDDAQEEQIAEKNVGESEMMKSAVLVDISQCKANENQIATEKNSDDINNTDKVSFPIKPAELMVCKIVSKKICDHIEGKGKQAACKLVSSLVCERIVSDGIEDKQGNEEITELVNDLLATYESDDCNLSYDTNHTSFTVQDISSLLSADVPLDDNLELGSLLLKGVDSIKPGLPSISPSLSSLSSASAAALLKQTSKGPNPFSITASGVHIYSNIFAMICPSLEINENDDIAHDICQILADVEGTTGASIHSGGIDGNNDDDSLKQKEKYKERMVSSRIYSWGTMNTADDKPSDLNRLKQLLFQEGKLNLHLRYHKSPF